jgi:F0F1-type ATP synthase alpha subunit
MKNSVYRMSDEEFATFTQKHPSVTRNDINELEELLTQKMYSDMALRNQRSEIELLKNKALGAMGTDREMRFSDIESGMLRASLSDGRQALKEILAETPDETPTCSDGTKMKNQGCKKKHHDDSGGY